MGFWGKIAKIASITMIAAGGVVSVGTAAMLGVGTNLTYEQEYDFTPNSKNVEQNMFISTKVATLKDADLKSKASLKLATSEISSSQGTSHSEFTLNSTTSNQLNLVINNPGDNKFFELDLTSVMPVDILSVSDATAMTWAVKTGDEAKITVEGTKFKNKIALVSGDNTFNLTLTPTGGTSGGTAIDVTLKVTLPAAPTTATLKDADLTSKASLTLANSEISGSQGTSHNEFTLNSTTSNQLNLVINKAATDNKFFELDLTNVAHGDILSVSDATGMTWAVKTGDEAKITVDGTKLKNKTALVSGDNTFNLTLTPTGGSANGTTIDVTLNVKLNIVSNPKDKIVIGVGSQNYWKMWVNGEFKEIPKLKKVSYEDFVNDARKLLESYPKHPYYSRIVLAYDLMVAGAVLFPISTLVWIAGAVLLVLNIKLS